jgi:hypothetical protein
MDAPLIVSSGEKVEVFLGANTIGLKSGGREIGQARSWKCLVRGHSLEVTVLDGAAPSATAEIYDVRGRRWEIRSSAHEEISQGRRTYLFLLPSPLRPGRYGIRLKFHDRIEEGPFAILSQDL